MDEKLFTENLQAYIHNEISDYLKVQMDRKIKEDPLARLEYEREKYFDGLLTKYMPKEEASYLLREQIIAGLDKRRDLSFFGINVNFPLASRAAAILTLVVFTVFVLTSNTNAFPIFRASIERHVDCLSGRYGAEITTSDLAAVTKWFEGRLSFSVRPPDLSRKGAQLIGARLCHLKDKPVALLFYEKDGHRISIYMLDSTDMRFEKAKDVSIKNKKMYVYAEQGYYSLLCLDKKHKGVGCIVVTDMQEEQLIALMS